MEKGKPALALLIGHALAKKGKAQHDPAPEMDDAEASDGEYKSDEEAHAHLKEIAADLRQAIKDDDDDAIADLLQEAFECLEMTKHAEGPHEDGESEGNPY